MKALLRESESDAPGLVRLAQHWRTWALQPLDSKASSAVPAAPVHTHETPISGWKCRKPCVSPAGHSRVKSFRGQKQD